MSGQSINLQMNFDNTDYCPYCYDGVKDYDEDGIDCSSSINGSCPTCNA